MRLMLAACSLGVVAFASALAVIVALQAGVYGSGSGIRIDSSLVVLARTPAWFKSILIYCAGGQALPDRETCYFTKIFATLSPRCPLA